MPDGHAADVLERIVAALDAGGGAPFERYGLAVWDGPGETWRLDGRYGQYVVVDQARDAVVTITAHEETGDHRLAELAADAVREARGPR